MRIQNLIDALAEARDTGREVHIPHVEINNTSGMATQTRTTKIGFNYDDKGDLELYAIG
ncbi:hypothetical protein KAU11_10345 [Candidatus Babeliales bacterium]|nr:hypothetical protein [Candidatus Babeliales bacterium]